MSHRIQVAKDELMGYIVLVERRVVENFRKCSDAIRDTGKHLDHSQVVKTLKNSVAVM